MTDHTRADAITEVADAVVRAHHELSEATQRLRSMTSDETDDGELLRSAIEADEAIVRLEAGLIASAATERIVETRSPAVMSSALEGVATNWRSRADDLMLQARLGRMDFSDAASDALVEFAVAGEDLAELVAALRDEDAEWTADLRDRSKAVVHDIRSAVTTLLAAARR